MTDLYYIHSDNSVRGPFTVEQIKERAMSGELLESDHVCAGKNGSPVSPSEFFAHDSPAADKSPDTSTRVHLPPRQKTISCGDCGGIVSKRAESCPHCGGPLGKSTRRPHVPDGGAAARPKAALIGGVAIVIGLLCGVIVLGVSFLNNDDSSSDEDDSHSQLSFSDKDYADTAAYVVGIPEFAEFVAATKKRNPLAISTARERFVAAVQQHVGANITWSARVNTINEYAVGVCLTSNRVTGKGLVELGNNPGMRDYAELLSVGQSVTILGQLQSITPFASRDDLRRWHIDTRKSSQIEADAAAQLVEICGFDLDSGTPFVVVNLEFGTQFGREGE